MSNPYMNKNTALDHVADSAFLSEETKVALRAYEGKFGTAHHESVVWRMIEPLDMTPQHAVLIPPDFIVGGDLRSAYKIAQREATKNGVEYEPTNRAMWPILSTLEENAQFRRRTAVAYRTRLQFEGFLRDYDPRVADMARVSIMNKVMVKSSPRHCLGRLTASYPRKDNVLPSNGPITSDEATAAMAHVGVDLTYLCLLKQQGGYPSPYGFDGNVMENSSQIRVNGKASAGAPIGGLVGDPAVKTAVIKMAHMLYEQVESYIAACPMEKVTTNTQMLQGSIKVKSFDAVASQMRILTAKYPERYTIVWKAKPDVVKLEKVIDKNRVINNIPAAARFIIASAAQAVGDMLPSAQDELLLPPAKSPQVENYVRGRNAFYSSKSTYNSKSKTYKGCTMTGDKFQGDMDALAHVSDVDYFILGRPDMQKYSFRVNGDDSKVRYIIGNIVGDISFDATNMDISQNSSMNREVHKSIYYALAMCDNVAAAMWLLVMREKHVVIEGRHTVKMKHGATSGISWIDVNNGAIMAVFIKRVMGAAFEHIVDETRRVGRSLSPSEVVEVFSVKTVVESDKMGLQIRIESSTATDFSETVYDDGNHGSGGPSVRWGDGYRSQIRANKTQLEAFSLRLDQLTRRNTGQSPIFLGFEIGPSSVEDIAWDREGTVWSTNHDMPRLLGGWSYPNRFHYKDHQLGPFEASRLASTFLALGAGNDEFYVKVVLPMKKVIIELLRSQVEEHGEVKESGGRFLVTVGEDMDNSIAGLLRFYESFGFEKLWRGALPMEVLDGDTEELLRAPPADTLQDLAHHALIRSKMEDANNLVRHLGPPNAGAKPNPANFGRRPPTREVIWVQHMRQSLPFLDNKDVIGPPKGGKKMSVGQWKKMLEVLDGEGYDDDAMMDEDEVEDQPRKQWAEYDSDDSREEKRRKEIEEEFEDLELNGDSDEAENNNARARAGY